MRRVHIQDVIERPNTVVSVQGRVGARVVNLDWSVGKSGNEFVDVTQALHAGDGRAKSGIIPEN